MKIELQLNTSVTGGHVQLRVDDVVLVDTAADVREDTILDMVNFGIYRQDSLEIYEMFVDDILVGDKAL